MSKTARSFGGLRMTVKVGCCHPRVLASSCSIIYQQRLMPRQPPQSLSSYVCKRPPNLIVVLRPPKDLAVLPCINKGLCHVNHPFFVILRPPKDLAVLPCINKGLCHVNRPNHCHPEASEGSGCLFLCNKRLFELSCKAYPPATNNTSLSLYSCPISPLYFGSKSTIHSMPNLSLNIPK
jgi:hypothetical protein